MGRHERDRTSVVTFAATLAQVKSSCPEPCDRAEGVIKPFFTVPVRLVLPLSGERRQNRADLLGLNLKA
ncbi:MAG: hypothetical protein DME61_03530 [Verrucomicrobia bacterium]|nr:MAG: hypothetical protein DME61_03530 [Verrucomicrobiota bacterium]